MAKQTCTTCPHLRKCWATSTNTGKSISKQNVIINILICRLQLGIDANLAAKNLIQMFKPGMLRLISAAQQTNDYALDQDQLLHDMSSRMIEYLLSDYKIGDMGRATPYLFDPQQGFLTKWIKWALNKSRKFYVHHELTGHGNNDDSQNDDIVNEFYDEVDSEWGMPKQSYGSYTPSEMELEQERTEFNNTLFSIIEDGITLNSNEYRVIKFCLHNGNELNTHRHIDGLHIALASIMGVSRPRITRLYKRAKEKLRARYAEICGR